MTRMSLTLLLPGAVSPWVPFTIERPVGRSLASEGAEMRMNERKEGERKNGWKGNIAVVVEREVDIWRPRPSLPLACLLAATAAAASASVLRGLLPSDCIGIGSGGGGSDIEENNQRQAIRVPICPPGGRLRRVCHAVDTKDWHTDGAAATGAAERS